MTVRHLDPLHCADNDARVLRAAWVTFGAGVAFLLVGLHLAAKGA